MQDSDSDADGPPPLVSGSSDEEVRPATQGGEEEIIASESSESNQMGYPDLALARAMEVVRDPVTKSEAGSDVGQRGSDSEESTWVVIRCYFMNGDFVGNCRCARDSSIGALKNQLIALQPDGLSRKSPQAWFENKTFVINQQEYSFQDDYHKFMLTKNIRRALQDEPELHCCIVCCTGLPTSEKPELQF